MTFTPETSQAGAARDEFELARAADSAPGKPASAGKYYTLLGICALLLLSLGLLGAWSLRELDEAYTRVITHAARRFSMLQNLGENLAQMDSRLKVDLVSPRAPKAGEFQSEIVRLQAQNQMLLQELAPFVDDAYFKAGLEGLRAQEKVLTSACSRLTSLLAEGELLTANAFRQDQLLPMVEDTRAAVRKLNRMITDHLLQVSNETTDKADWLTTLVVGLGALPIVLGAALFLLVVAILCLLAWQLRHDQTLS